MQLRKESLILSLLCFYLYSILEHRDFVFVYTPNTYYYYNYYYCYYYM